MSTMSLAVTDSATMVRRNLKRAMRYPALVVSSVLIPVFMLLLFGGVFGGALGAGIGGSASYIDYVVPGVLLMAAASGSISTAITVSLDMTNGIINRFRTMAIARSSVLTGHVLGSMLQTMLSIVLVVGVALLMGFRPDANPVEWLAAAGLLALLVFGLTWLAAAMGLVAKSVESASNMPTLVPFLPLLGSGFVPTDSMPAGVRVFAEYQPFTPMIETVRGLLLGTPIGASGVLAVGWCLLITAVGYLWARNRFRQVR